MATNPEHKEKRKQSWRKYTASHPDKRRETVANWKAKNQEHLAEYARNRRLQNPEKFRAQQRAKWAERKAELERLRALHAPKPKSKPGRKAGVSKDKLPRIELAAAFKVLNWNQREMSEFVYSDTPLSAYPNTRNLFSEYRQTIEETASAMAPKTAEMLVRVAGAEPYRK